MNAHVKNGHSILETQEDWCVHPTDRELAAYGDGYQAGYNDGRGTEKQYSDVLTDDLKKARAIIEAVELLYFNATENGIRATVDLAAFNRIASMITVFNRETEDREAGVA